MNTRKQNSSLTPTFKRPSPRTVIRGENKKVNNGIRALIDWLNVTFSFLPAQSNIQEFYNRFSEVTDGVFGILIPEGHGLFFGIILLFRRNAVLNLLMVGKTVKLFYPFPVKLVL